MHMFPLTYYTVIGHLLNANYCHRPNVLDVNICCCWD